MSLLASSRRAPRARLGLSLGLSLGMMPWVSQQATATVPACNATLPTTVRLPRLSHATDYLIHDYDSVAAYHAARRGKNTQIFEGMLKTQLTLYQNLSGARIAFPSGPKDVYRSAILSWSPLAIQELAEERGVASVFHLSNSKIFDQTPWVKAEQEGFARYGVTDYRQLVDYDYRDYSGDKQDEGYRHVADLIHQIEASPGATLIHCLGGTHRTQIVFELMQKCYNKLSLENIEARVKCHSDWESEARPGSFNAGNMSFIRDFPCEILTGASK